ncbi:fibrillin-2-like isoform X2 [Liolophura sinensis]|uniref:fibrillin-2-like isoform X2 n=1 Tax=Liolophura sinensis TaxID=3198878 RepID=UPI0031580FA8
MRLFVLTLCLLACLSVKALSPSGQNVCRHTRIERYTARVSYYASCGWWSRCTRYRYVVRTRTAVDYSCCSGWNSADNIHCKRAMCTGSAPGTCPNGGVCVRPTVCSCRRGFGQPKCVDINECSLNTDGCQQVCVNTVGSFRCSCRAGYGLLADRKNCKPVCNGLTPGICANGGTCVRPGVCQCRTGYALPRCDDVNECQIKNGGCSQTCQNLRGSYRCGCRSGYALLSDGKSCKPHCHGAPIGTCQNGGTCVQPDVCTCPVGFAAPRCDDINECLQNNGGCSGTCTNTEGSFTCSCGHGYQLAADMRTCKAICQGLPAGTCRNGGTCVQPDVCECPGGFSAPACNDTNECLSGNGGCDHQCENTEGSFRCRCSSGYLLAEDGKACADIDECVEGTSGCSKFCVNDPGSFHCSCPLGYQLGVDARQCQDLDECQANNGDCTQTCSNTEGSFACSCRDGFVLDKDKKTCRDTNECLSGNGGCDHQCENTEGSFRCRCSSGYLLAEDGKACADIDECVEGTSGCSNFCVNDPGSFHCSCPLGYQLGVDARQCQDLDECQANNGGCTQTCSNTEGSFACSCRDGFVLDKYKKTCRVNLNLRISRTILFGPVTTFILNWDSPTEADGIVSQLGYVVEISNLMYNPASVQRTFYPSFGSLLQAKDGETTVRVRAVQENGLSPAAEIVIPAVGEENTAPSDPIFAPA